MQPVQLPEHRIETRRVADLVPADYNPRKISPKAMEGLKKSLSEFGAVQPIVVNERTGHIVGGHQRVKALAALGQVETTVVVVDLSLTREKALNVALNNPHISGEFDDGLSDLLDEINGEMPELFADLRLDELLAPVDEPKEGLTDPDDVPESMPNPVTRSGDVWVMGDHRIICGSCTDAGAVALVMNGERADLCLTDPPYGLGNTDSEKNDYAEYEDTRDNLVDLVAAFLPIAQSVAPVVVLTPGMETTASTLTRIGRWRGSPRLAAGAAHGAFAAGSPSFVTAKIRSWRAEKADTQMRSSTPRRPRSSATRARSRSSSGVGSLNGRASAARPSTNRSAAAARRSLQAR